MKKANLFLNGSFTEYGDIIDRTLYTIAADGGVVNAIKNKCITAAIAGDGDSIQEIPARYKKEIQSIPFISTPDQDFTDFEKALTILQLNGYTYINVYCFDGKRIDHMISGLSICSGFKTMTIILHTHEQIVMRLPYTFSLQCKIGTTISLLPFPTASNVTTNGLQWELNNSTLKLGGFLSVSNKTRISTINIRYTKGTLYIFRPIKI
jgi:thiamine pyrophosphokinase